MAENEKKEGMSRPTITYVQAVGPEENPEEEKSGVTFSDIWHRIIKHWVAWVIFMLVGFAAGVLYGRFIKDPEYQTSTQMMIVSSDSSDTDTNISTAKNKAEILYLYASSTEVKENLAKKLVEDGETDYQLEDGSYDTVSVSKLYSVTIPTVTSNNTSIFVTVTSTAKTEDLAIKVANYVPEIIIDLVNTEGSKSYSYLHDSVSSLGDATSAQDTSTSNVSIAFIGLLIGAVVGALYGIIYEAADNKVSSKKALERLTGTKVIGMIPMYSDNTPALAQPTSKREAEEEKKGKESHHA